MSAAELERLRQEVEHLEQLAEMLGLRKPDEDGIYCITNNSWFTVVSGVIGDRMYNGYTIKEMRRKYRQEAAKAGLLPRKPKPPRRAVFDEATEVMLMEETLREYIAKADRKEAEEDGEKAVG